MSRRWVRWILGMAPRSFRSRYGEELLATYEARAEAADREGRSWAFGAREVAGATWLVCRLWLGVDGAARRERGGEGSVLEQLRHDVRSGVRALRRNPGFSTAAVGVLALGIGATSAIFAVVNAYFFRPLPFADPDQLVTVFETNPEFGWVDATAAPANLFDWREQVDAFVDVSGYSEFTDELTLFREGEPGIVTGTEVMGNFFSTLGAPAALGRTFRLEETWLGEDDVVVLSHDLWVSHFGADPSVAGQVMELADRTPLIVGVMPEGFRFPDDDVQLWYPIGWDRAATAEAWFRRAHFVRAFARLAPGITHEEADAELQVVVRRLQQQYPQTNSVMGAGIAPMRDFLLRDVRTSLTVLLGAVSFLLLLACTNVANLMLVRAGERSREVALRRALGASRSRLIRQMLTESSLLAVLGGAVGLGVGWLGARALAATVPMGIDGATDLALDYRVVAFTLGTAGLSALLFGTAPALGAAVGDSGRGLSEGGRRSTAGRGGLRAAGLLVSVQVALALLLVVGAGLMVRTFTELRRVDPGFRAEGVLAVQFAVQSARYPERDDVLSFYDRFADALEARPGIERVGSVAQLPLDGPSWSSVFQAEDWPPERVGFEILHRRADRGYFEALGIPLLRGRMFESTDGPEDAPVVVVNEAFVQEHFPGDDPIGRRIAFDRTAGPESTWYEIIGVVGDQRQESLSRAARPEVFESRDQDWGRNSWIVIRGSGEPVDLVPTVRAVLHEIDPLIPIARVRPLDAVRAESMARERLVLTLLGVFGVVALLLAAVGVYAVTARAARRRTQEIGIRLALGARGADVLGLMLRHGVGVVALGLVAGVLAALVATRALASLLYGVEPTDPVTLGAVVALLGGVAIAACYIPARRATAVDPLTSLRSE
ncbi:MAG TPA: ABC transporter permease [Longimicrobiales bacterium]|nr:ABC transporter permease [Longimicrobiales bacterium]